MKPKRLFFTVTNDLTYDQRMHRICGSLADAGYEVTLVGRELPESRPLEKKNYRQVRLKCLNRKGKLFYAEFNLRLYFYLSRRSMDGLCAVDLDTVLPCVRVSRKKNIPAIYDAHEFFTELKEVRSRPFVYRSWLRIERSAIPRFRYAYTVSESLATEFSKRYQIKFETIRNLPVLEPLFQADRNNHLVLFQGAVNEARCFESLVPAMKDVDGRLMICGDGNFMDKLRKLITLHKLQDKIELTGMLLPEHLKPRAAGARVGLCLSEKEGLNQYLALPNKFLDYIHAGLPQVAMNFPEYRKINDKYKVAILLDEADPLSISNAVNKLLHDDVLHAELRTNALRAREELNWQLESQKLVAFYNEIFRA